jgi:hypothetical protein
MGEVSLIIFVCNGSNTTLIRHPLLSKAIEIFIEKWRYCIEYLKYPVFWIEFEHEFGFGGKYFSLLWVM